MWAKHKGMGICEYLNRFSLDDDERKVDWSQMINDASKKEL